MKLSLVAWHVELIWFVSIFPSELSVLPEVPQVLVALLGLRLLLRIPLLLSLALSDIREYSVPQPHLIWPLQQLISTLLTFLTTVCNFYWRKQRTELSKRLPQIVATGLFYVHLWAAHTLQDLRLPTTDGRRLAAVSALTLICIGLHSSSFENWGRWPKV